MIADKTVLISIYQNVNQGAHDAYKTGDKY